MEILSARRREDPVLAPAMSTRPPMNADRRTQLALSLGALGIFSIPGAPTDEGGAYGAMRYFENGGGAWAVQSWNCCVDGTAMYSDKYDVSPGDVIQGTMAGSNCDAGSGICQNWVITTKDVNNGRASVMNTTPFALPGRCRMSTSPAIDSRLPSLIELSRSAVMNFRAAY